MLLADMAWAASLMLPWLVAGAQRNENVPYYPLLTPEQHPHALALRQKNLPILNQQYSTMTPVSSSTVAAMSNRYIFDPAAPEFVSSKIHSRPTKPEQQTGVTTKPQQPFTEGLMHHIPPTEAQKTAKELGIFAQSRASSQQHKKRDGCNPPNRMGMHMCATVQQEQPQSIASPTTASAGTTWVSPCTLSADYHC